MGASGNYVVINIKTAGTARPDLTELKATLDELAHKVATARVNVDDKDAAAKLLSMNARLAALGKKVSNPRIDLAGAASVEAQLAFIDLELGRVNDKARGAAGGIGGLRLRMAAAAAAGSGFTGLLTKIVSGFVGLSAFGPPGYAAMALIVAGTALLVAALGGMVAALVAASLGLAAFAVLAAPTFAGIVKGYSSVSAARQAYQAAQAKYAQDPTAANLKAQQTALDHLKVAWAQLSPASRTAVQGIDGLKASFDRYATALRPQVMTIFNTALKGLAGLLPFVAQLARAAAPAVEGLMKGFEGFAKSQGFKSFMNQMQTLAGPAITALGRGLGQVVIALGKMFQSMANPQGVATLRDVLGAVAAMIRLIGYSFQGLNKVMPTVAGAMITTGEVILNVAHAMAIGFLDSTNSVLHGMLIIAKALHLPQSDLKQSIQSLDNWRQNVDKTFRTARNALDGWSQTVRSAPKIFVLQANITDLQNKLATARGLLGDRRLTATRRASIKADISALRLQINLAKQLLAQIANSVTTAYVNVVTGTGHSLTGGMAAGGITGAASGGIRNRLTMVGEHGRELLDLAPGTRVHSNPDTERMMAGGGGQGGGVALAVMPGAGGDVERFIVHLIRTYVQAYWGGNVQAAFGQRA
jgi:hypothetical protein